LPINVGHLSINVFGNLSTIDSENLLKVEYNQDLFYATNSKLLLMKIYFELNEFEAFQSLALSFKSFLFFLT
jgi:hypothetical protein